MRLMRFAAAIVAALVVQHGTAPRVAAQGLPPLGLPPLGLPPQLAAVPAAFAAEQWDAATGPLLAALEARATALPPVRRAAVVLDIVSAYALNRRFDDARRWAETADADRRFYALALIANTQAIAGEAEAARASLRDAMGAGAAGGLRRVATRAEQLVATMARLGDGDAALALANTLSGFERAIAFARIAGIGPSGPADGVPERALAALRDWTPGDLPPGAASSAQAFIARAQIRHGDGAGALARLAGVSDPAWRAYGFLMATWELADWGQQALSEQALARAEQELGITAASDLAAAVPHMPPLARQWLGHAYLRSGRRERVAPALAAYLAEAALPETSGGDDAAQVSVLSRAAQVVGGARQEIAEAAARNAAPAPAPAPAGK